ncbi:two-component system response regulator [Methylobacterium sp. Leaf104]|uniref:response regulator transcription factor n=1 Tax=Methylobacterium TaxID=407 RepID=UPI0006F392E1|nr:MULTISPECIES: response regulator transcription factor [Methylobacterium]KQP29693.1 two-component system response regulator [Methylobacterium sp. Leaf104]MCI9881753.1 response regulator transcription factor [Methylobacterium goesingense]
MTSGAASILIADDHPVILRGFRTLMEDAGMTTIHEATTIVEAYRAFYRQRPGMVVADLTFGDQGLTGLSLIRRIRTLERRTRILAFSMHDDPTIIARALENGAIGYVLKDAPATEFLRAFDQVRRGKSYLDHDIALRVAMLNATAERSSASDLSERELQVLSLIKDGNSYQAIAEKLSMKYKTVVNVISAIRRKSGSRSFAELVNFSMYIKI